MTDIVIRVVGKMDIPRARATIRLHLLAHFFNPLSIARATGAFTALHEILVNLLPDNTMSLNLQIVDTFPKKASLVCYVPVSKELMECIKNLSAVLKGFTDDQEIKLAEDVLSIKVFIQEKEVAKS